MCIPALVLCCVSFGFYSVFLCCQLSNRSRRIAFLTAAARFLAFSRPARAEKGPLERRVREIVALERIRCVRCYAHPFLHCFSFCIIFVSILAFNEGCGSAFAWLLTPAAAELIQLMLHFLMCLIFAAAPRVVSIRSIDIAYVLFTIWWIVRGLDVWTGAPIEASLSMVCSRAILGLAVCKASVTGACNLVVMAAHCASQLRGGSPDDTELRRYLVMEEILSTAIIVFIHFSFEHWVCFAARHALDIKASSRAEVTARRLLSALCDAVVTLGPDLRISAHAPKLANLLLEGHSTQALKDAHFLDFMAGTDQDRFRDFMSRAPDPGEEGLDLFDLEPAQALNVHLQNSSGSAVHVQLFHSHFYDLNGQVSHLIGICEAGVPGGARVDSRGEVSSRGDAPPAPMRIHSSQPPVHTAFPRSVASDELRRGSSEDTVSTHQENIDSQSESSFPGSFTGMASYPSRAVASSQQREVALTFDVLRFIVQDRQTKVIDASLLETESLQHWVAEWASCRTWVQDFVNAVLRPVNAASWRGVGAPSSLSFQVAFRGTCTLPPDFLTRTPPSIGPALEERVPRARSQSPSPDIRPGVGLSTSSDAGGIQGPPMRLAVSRIKIQRARHRSRDGSMSPMQSEGSHRRHHRSRVVQPSLLGASQNREVSEPLSGIDSWNAAFQETDLESTGHVETTMSAGQKKDVGRKLTQI